MKAYVLDRYGKQQSLRLGDMPEPVPAADEVLVDIHAAGLNQLDAKIRDGAFKPILPYKPPFVLGHDLAGTVVSVGQAVRGLSRATRSMPARATAISALSPSGSPSSRATSR